MPPAVPPATPIKSGLFVISNLSGCQAVNFIASSSYLASLIIDIGFKNVSENVSFSGLILLAKLYALAAFRSFIVFQVPAGVFDNFSVFLLIYF